MSGKMLEIAECDEAGNIVATFIQSQPNPQGVSRVDMILPETTKSPWQRLLDVFLPAGYPHSVSEDYLEYQIYDSLQAFSSSIAGMLSSRAVLSSVGVGDSTASPTAALLLSVLQESAGRLATILFAHRFGTSLEPERKMYRLLADILNDTAFILDCLSPVFPKTIRVVVLSFSSVLRALCGVAAGSAKASLSAHFAKWGNLGELNAKDSSQETVISLLGMLVGSLVVSWVTTPLATWTTLTLLLSVHLETNRRAVRAVRMRTLNRQRATLVYHHLRKGHVPTPEEISKQERIFERDGVLRGPQAEILGYCSMGATMSRLLGCLYRLPHPVTKAVRLPHDLLQRLLHVNGTNAYLIWILPQGSTMQVHVAIKQEALSKDLLIAWWQALEAATEAKAFWSRSTSDQLTTQKAWDPYHLLRRTAESAASLFSEYHTHLRDVGWDMDVALEIPSSTRISIIK